MFPTPRREPEDMPGAENAEEPIGVGNELESLELNSGDLVSCVDEVAKPGHDIPVSHVWELCTIEIKTATQSSVVRLSDVSYFECSLSGMHEETPRAIDSAIIAKECSENRVQKYNRPEHEPHSGGTSESSLSVAVLDINQEAQDNGESKDMMGLFICTERDMQDHVIDCEASDSASSVGIQSRRNRKSRKPHSLVKNSPGSRKSKCVCDTSHVEENSKWVKGYGTRNIEPAEDAEPNVIAVKQEFNLKNTPTGFTELHLQCVDKTEPSPSKYSSLNFSTSSGIQHKKQPMYIDPRLPKGWTRSVVQRKKGASAGKFDVYIFSPEGKKFRSRRELKSFLLGTDLFLNADDFDFSVNGKGGTVEGFFEMDSNLNDVYQEDAVAASSATILETGNMTTTEQLEPDILLSIKKEDLDEEIQFSDGTSVGQTSKKFFELTPVEFEVRDSFTGYDTNVLQDSSDDRSTRTERKMPSKWSEEATLKFVKEYKQLECLWDVKSASYRNKAVRDTAYMKLADCANLPGFTVQEAKNKIKNLRSTYSQELKKVKQSKKSGLDEVYQPSLIWYKEIDSFLGPVVASRDVQAPTEADVSSVTEEGITENEDTLEGNLQSLSPSNSQLSTPTESADIQADRKSLKRIHPNPVPQSLQCRKKKAMHGSQLMSSASAFSQSLNFSKNSDDEFDAFGKSVAAQLKKFSLAGALKTQVKIQSLLTQERIIDAMESESTSPHDDFLHTHTSLTPMSHHCQASHNELTCCSCVHDVSQHVYGTSDSLDDTNSTDILSQAVNSILPQ